MYARSNQGVYLEQPSLRDLIIALGLMLKSEDLCVEVMRNLKTQAYELQLELPDDDSVHHVIISSWYLWRRQVFWLQSLDHESTRLICFNAK